MPQKQQRPQPERVGLPSRFFLFTLDQVATMLAMDEKSLRRSHVYFDRHDQGPKPPSRMMARNIAPEDERPDWRIAEGEVVAWLRRKGFRLYDRGWAIE